MTSAGTKRELVSLIVDLLAHSQVLVDFHCEDSINERYVCVDSYGVIRIELCRGRYTLSL